MADRFRIRPTDPSDLAALVDLEVTAFSDPWDHSMIAESLAADSTVSLVIEDDSRKLAGSMMARLIGDEAEILTIAIDPLWRRRGLARRLLAETMTTLADSGARSVWLEVRAGNAAARALYDSAGFVAAGVRRGYYRRPLEDALILVHRPSA